MKDELWGVEVKPLLRAAEEGFALAMELAGGNSGLYPDAVPTGFRDLDVLTGGMRPGELTVVASRPGVGKTSFALNVAVNAARDGAKVLLFAPEADAATTALRIVAGEARVPLRKIASGYVTEQDWMALAVAMAEPPRLDLSICSAPSIRWDTVGRVAGWSDRGEGQMLIVADELGIDAVGKYGANPPASRAAAAPLLKRLARNLGAAVLMTSCLPGPFRSPTCSAACKGSASVVDSLGEAGRVSDAVIILDRSLSDSESEEPGGLPMNVANVGLMKHRRAPMRELKLAFVPEYGRFFNYMDDSQYF